MTGRDPNSIGMVILIGGLIVAVVGPLLSSKGSSSEKVISFNWYVLGGLAMLVGACILFT
jgi:predicted membrane channel-forming protein YqfA (hemolysin III family)